MIRTRPRAVRKRWPGALEAFITRRTPMMRIREALEAEDPDETKTVITVAGSS